MARGQFVGQPVAGEDFARRGAGPFAGDRFGARVCLGGVAEGVRNGGISGKIRLVKNFANRVGVVGIGRRGFRRVARGGGDGRRRGGRGVSRGREGGTNTGDGQRKTTSRQHTREVHF